MSHRLAIHSHYLNKRRRISQVIFHISLGMVSKTLYFKKNHLSYDTTGLSTKAKGLKLRQFLQVLAHKKTTLMHRLITSHTIYLESIIQAHDREGTICFISLPDILQNPVV